MKLVFLISIIISFSSTQASAEKENIKNNTGENKIFKEMILQKIKKLEDDNDMLKKVLKTSIISSTTSCSELPGNWIDASEKNEKLAGKFLLGQSNSYSVGDEGGMATVTLTENQMPLHGHRISTKQNHDVHDGLAGNSSQNKGILSTFQDIPSQPTWNTVLPDMLEKTGKSEPHENMPPYYVVYFCQLDEEN